MADDSLQNSHAIKDGRKGHLPILCKIAEVAIATIAVGLIVDPYISFQRIFNKPRTSLHDIAMIYITLGGFMIINCAFIISYVLGDRIPKRTAILFSSIGCLFHLIAASIIINNWRKLLGDYVFVQNNAIFPSKLYMDMLLSGGIFTFVNTAIFAFDVFAIYKYSS